MSAIRFRQYAEECRRTAERLPPDQRPKMLEIAKAWEACARMIEDEEKKDGDREPGHPSIVEPAKILAAVARRQRHATAATTKDVRLPSCA